MATKVDKTAFSTTSFKERDIARKKHWQSMSVAERMSALETMRISLFGYNPTTCRLQRILKITTRS